MSLSPTLIAATVLVVIWLAMQVYSWLQARHASFDWLPISQPSPEPAPRLQIDPIYHLLQAQEAYIRDGQNAKAAAVAKILTEGPA